MKSIRKLAKRGWVANRCSKLYICIWFFMSDVQTYLCFTWFFGFWRGHIGLTVNLALTWLELWPASSALLRRPFARWPFYPDIWKIPKNTIWKIRILEHQIYNNHRKNIFLYDLYKYDIIVYGFWNFEKYLLYFLAAFW